MDGVINLYKEKGKTSFSAVNELRRELGVKKAGHTGTLDPDATGVLPVCLGKATKLVSLLMDSDKCYRAVMLLGRRTDTQDVSGQTLEALSYQEVVKKLQEDVTPEINIKEDLQKKNSAENKIIETEDSAFGFERTACENKIKNIFKRFTGEIEQVPPMYSALKVNGVKLVDAARRGEEIERKARRVTVYGFEDICVHEDLVHISFSVRCSKGTYIRTLCEDMGKALGLPACMESLERTEASGLRAEDSFGFEEVAELNREGKTEVFLKPIDSFLTQYQALTVSKTAVKKVLVGNFITETDIINKDGEIFDVSQKYNTGNCSQKKEDDIKTKDPSCKTSCYRIYDETGKFYALYKYDDAKKTLKPHTMFI